MFSSWVACARMCECARTVARLLRLPCVMGQSHHSAGGIEVQGADTLGSNRVHGTAIRRTAGRFLLLGDGPANVGIQPAVGHLDATNGSWWPTAGVHGRRLADRPTRQLRASLESRASCTAWPRSYIQVVTESSSSKDSRALGLCRVVRRKSMCRRPVARRKSRATRPVRRELQI